MSVSINYSQHNDTALMLTFCSAECHIIIFMLKVIMVSIAMPSAIMLNVVILSVVMPSAVMQSVGFYLLLC